MRYPGRVGTMIGEENSTYWPRQLSFATVFGAVVFVVAFLGSCIGFLSYFNYVIPSGKSNAPRAFFYSLTIAFFMAAMVFGIVMWRGYIRRKQELASPEE